MSEKKDRKAVAAWLVETQSVTAEAADRVAAAFPADWVADIAPRLARSRKAWATANRARVALDDAEAAVVAIGVECKPYADRAARILAAMRDEADGGGA